jgi:thiol oxidase
MRSFILNFFSCKECSDNFANETKDWIENLKEPHDAVLYLWKVHNNVNKRLSLEENNDPSFPKIIFPSQQQCEKCYTKKLENKTNIELNSIFDSNQVYIFLKSYYSKESIENLDNLGSLAVIYFKIIFIIF